MEQAGEHLGKRQVEHVYTGRWHKGRLRPVAGRTNLQNKKEGQKEGLCVLGLPTGDTKYPEVSAGSMGMAPEASPNFTHWALTTFTFTMTL